SKRLPAAGQCLTTATGPLTTPVRARRFPTLPTRPCLTALPGLSTTRGHAVPEFDLLRALPKTKRNIAKRRDGKDPSVVATAKQFGEMYFDGPREYGYGGYRYDGRWVPVAKDMIAHFGLEPGMRVLDIGCAKGFLVKDLQQAGAGIEAFGLDISRYAL